MIMCKDCTFCEPLNTHGNGFQGLCHRNPPHPFPFQRPAANSVLAARGDKIMAAQMEIGVQPIFPPVGDGMWCGEARERKDE